MVLTCLELHINPPARWVRLLAIRTYLPAPFFARAPVTLLLPRNRQEIALPYEAITAGFTAVGVLISGGGLIFVARQVRLAKQQIQHLRTTTAKEDARRKRQ